MLHLNNCYSSICFWFCKAKKKNKRTGKKERMRSKMKMKSRTPFKWIKEICDCELCVYALSVRERESKKGGFLKNKIKEKKKRMGTKMAIVILWQFGNMLNKTPIKVFIYLSIQYPNWNSQVCEKKYHFWINTHSVIINAAVLSLRFEHNETERSEPKHRRHNNTHPVSILLLRTHYFWDRQSCSFPNIFFYYHRILSWYSPFTCVWAPMPMPHWLRPIGVHIVFYLCMFCFGFHLSCSSSILSYRK